MSKKFEKKMFVFDILSHSGFVPGRLKTEEFVPGFLLLLLSWDSGTRNLFLSQDKGKAGQGNFFVPGQRDNGTSRPVKALVQTQPRAKAVTQGLTVKNHGGRQSGQGLGKKV